MKEDQNIRKNKEIYKVPENYFDEFQSRMTEITSNDRAENFSFSAGKSKLSLRLAYSVPAFLVVLVIGYLSFFNPKTDAEGLASVSTEDLINFLEEDGVTEEELISFLDISTQELDVSDENDFLDEIDESTLEDLTDEIDVFNEYL